MATLEYPSGRIGYVPLVDYVRFKGRERRPRGLLTHDVGHTTIVLQSPFNALPTGNGRNLSRRVAAAEAIQLIGAFSDPQLLFDASPNFKDYVEEDGTFWGAYGKRVGDQVAHVVTKLKSDLDTRQAVITIWNPERDNEPGKKDYPCTLSLVFTVNSADLLELDVTMRSNDVWRGLPYDLFQFTQLQLTVARVLNLEPGVYRHHTHSLHLYADDFAAADHLLTHSTGPLLTEEQPVGIGRLGQTWLDVKHTARLIPYLLADPQVENLTISEEWYWRVLHGYKPNMTVIPRA